MKREENLAQGVLLEEEELSEVNGGMRMQNEAGLWIEQTEGKTPNNQGGGAEPIEDEALEDVSGGMRVQAI